MVENPIWGRCDNYGPSLGLHLQVNNENHLQISGCVFEKNTVTGLSGHTYGGGLAVHESHGGVTVSDTLFQENTAADIGGAFAGVNIKKLEVVDSNFLGNKAGRYAGATYVQVCPGIPLAVVYSDTLPCTTACVLFTALLFLCKVSIGYL